MVWTGCLECRWIYFVAFKSGRTVPGDGETLLRNEGVGIVLDQPATVAWKNAGETWEAVSSRIVTARLQWIRDMGGEKS